MAPPNIVMLVTDNQSADSLGCYGNVEHETPNIDRLARQGAMFLNTFCTNGLCSPTRASILTGLMPSQHGVHLAIPDDDVLPKAADYDVTREFPTLPWSLRRAGYATAMIGKWHLGNHRCPGHGFDHWVALTKGHTTDFYDNRVYRTVSRPTSPIGTSSTTSPIVPSSTWKVGIEPGPSSCK